MILVLVPQLQGCFFLALIDSMPKVTPKCNLSLYYTINVNLLVHSTYLLEASFEATLV